MASRRSSRLKERKASLDAMMNQYKFKDSSSDDNNSADTKSEEEQYSPSDSGSESANNESESPVANNSDSGSDNSDESESAGSEYKPGKTTTRSKPKPKPKPKAKKSRKKAVPKRIIRKRRKLSDSDDDDDDDDESKGGSGSGSDSDSFGRIPKKDDDFVKRRSTRVATSKRPRRNYNEDDLFQSFLVRPPNGRAQAAMSLSPPGEEDDASSVSSGSERDPGVHVTKKRKITPKPSPAKSASASIDEDLKYIFGGGLSDEDEVGAKANVYRPRQRGGQRNGNNSSDEPIVGRNRRNGKGKKRGNDSSDDEPIAEESSADDEEAAILEQTFEEWEENQNQLISEAREETHNCYTYWKWLEEEVESDTEVQVSVRANHFKPGKVDRVDYHFTIRHRDSDCENTWGEALDVHIDLGKLRPMPQASAESESTPDAPNEDTWYRPLAAGDRVEYQTETGLWCEAEIIRRFRIWTIKYHGRRGEDEEIINESTVTDVKQKIQPISSDDKHFESTPDLPSTPTRDSYDQLRRDAERNRDRRTAQAAAAAERRRGGTRSRNKANRFAHSSDDDDEQMYGDGYEDGRERSVMSNASSVRSFSRSPVDASDRKVDLILYTMDLPLPTVQLINTFDHYKKAKAPIVLSSPRFNAIDAPIAASAELAPMPDVDMVDKENHSESSNNPNSVANGMEVDTPPESPAKSVDLTSLVTKYLVKYSNRSYHHCEWLTEREILHMDADSKLKNFIKKWEAESTAQHLRLQRRINHCIEMRHFDRVMFFNSLYLQIDRIIDKCEPGEIYPISTGFANSRKKWKDCLNNTNETMYLVKWNSLQYDEATWELHSFLSAPEFDGNYNAAAEIALYETREKIPKANELNPPGTVNRYHRVRPRKEEMTTIDVESEFKGGNKLRYYQCDGVNWLMFNWQQRRPCMLADEMGLGKTVQTVTFVNQLVTKHGVRGPFLIVAPLSTIGHWSREFRAWSDLNVIVYHGSQDSRERMHETEFGWLRAHGRVRTQTDLRKLNRNNWKFHVVITTAQVVNQDVDELSYKSIKWSAVIVDEAHALKSMNSLLYRNLREVQNYKNFLNPKTKVRDVVHSVLLTGTPIQNNMDELWALLHFMDPKQFPEEDMEDFVDKYGTEKLAKRANELKDELAPRLLQRMKSLVEKNLAQREEKIIWVELTLFQKKWYKALYEKSYETLTRLGSRKSSLMNVSMQLRKCCNHPFLINEVESTISPEGTGELEVCENVIKASGKLVLLDKLLPKLKKEGHRVLIFSQMTSLLDIVEDFLTYREYLYERLDGGVTGSARQESIDRFQNDESIFCFILTTRAGGVGINLVAADTVIIYDSDWNPMNDVQAIARCHRIGQTRQVSVYRLVTRNCYEEQMFRRADQKMALNKVVMGDMKDLSKSDINDMLRSGAIGMFLKDKETDEEINQFTNASIDEILNARVEDVKLDENEAKNVEGAMFSEAVFVANATDTNLDIHAADFWDHIGLQGAEESSEEEIDDFGPYKFRKRRKATNKKKRYNDGNDDADDDAYELSGASDNDSDSSDAGEGETLLSLLCKYVWGDWDQIYKELSKVELTNIKFPKEIKPPTPPPDASTAATDTTVAAAADPDATSTSTSAMNVDTTAAPVAVATTDVAVVTTEAAVLVAEAKPRYSPTLSVEQQEHLRMAAVETIAGMLQLMKPEARTSALRGKEILMFDPHFRGDVITTLIEQWEAETNTLIVDAKNKARDDYVWKKNKPPMPPKAKATVGENGVPVVTPAPAPPVRPGYCKMGCHRTVDVGLTTSGHKFDTCCRDCATKQTLPGNTKQIMHNPKCENAFSNEFAIQCFKNVLKRYGYLPKDIESDTIVVDSDDDEKWVESTRELLTADMLREELEPHNTEDLLLRFKFKTIDKSVLKQSLREKDTSHRKDVKSLIIILDKLFVMKWISDQYWMSYMSKHNNDVDNIRTLARTEKYVDLPPAVKSLNGWDAVKMNKSVPPWWQCPQFDHILVHGSIVEGFGEVSESYALKHGFSLTYDAAAVKAAAAAAASATVTPASSATNLLGDTKASAIPLDLSPSPQHPSSNPVSDVTNSIQKVSLQTSAAAAGPPPDMKQRKWPAYNKQTQRLTHLTALFRKNVKNSHRNARRILLEDRKAKLLKLSRAKAGGFSSSTAIHIASNGKNSKSGDIRKFVGGGVIDITQSASSSSSHDATNHSIGVNEKEKKHKHKHKHKKDKDNKHKHKHKKHKHKKNDASATTTANGTDVIVVNGNDKKNAFTVMQQASKHNKDKKSKDKKKKKAFKCVRDEAGKIVYPIIVGKRILIMKLGDIEYSNPNFHTLSHIWPLGFKAATTAESALRAGSQTQYFTEISRSDTSTMTFTVTCSDDPNFRMTGPSLSKVWGKVMTQVHKTQNKSDKSGSVTVSGPSKIGLNHPEVIKLIEELPDAERCENYRFQFRTVDNAASKLPTPPKKKSKSHKSKSKSSSKAKDKKSKKKAAADPSSTLILPSSKGGPNRFVPVNDVVMAPTPVITVVPPVKPPVTIPAAADVVDLCESSSPPKSASADTNGAVMNGGGKKSRKRTFKQSMAGDAVAMDAKSDVMKPPPAKKLKPNPAAKA